MDSQDGCGYDFRCDDDRAEVRLEAKTIVPGDRLGQVLTGHLARPKSDQSPSLSFGEGRGPLGDVT